MTREPLKNVPASVRDRLTQRARAAGDNVQLILTRYAIERLLYRLSASQHRERFILKGAMLFSLWGPTPYRATGNLDLLGTGNPEIERLISVFRAILQVEVVEDGVAFRPDTLRAEPTRPQDEYAGVRILFDASIANARLPIQVDIGFGDAITPAPQEIEYPSLIGMPAPKLKAYPPETVVAEKLEALVSLGVANSRMKDFFDLWAISRTFAFDGPVLTKAIRATFERRGTTPPTEIPFGLSEAFAADPVKQTQWQAFLRRTEIAMAPEPLIQIIPSIASFLMPVLQSAADERTSPGKWPVGGPWGD